MRTSRWLVLALLLAVVAGTLSSGHAAARLCATGAPCTAPGLAPFRDIPIGIGPAAEDFCISANIDFVANQGTNEVAELVDNPSLREPFIFAIIGVGTKPVAVAVDQTNCLAYVANNGSNDVSVIANHTEVARMSLPVGAPAPAALVVDPDIDVAPGKQGRVYVFGGNRMTIFDTETRAIVLTKTFTVSQITAAVRDAAHGFLYVATKDHNVVIIDQATNDLAGFPGFGSNALALAYDSTRGVIFVARDDAAGIVIIEAIDTATRSPIEGFNLQLPKPVTGPIRKIRGLAVDPVGLGGQPLLYILARVDDPAGLKDEVWAVTDYLIPVAAGGFEEPSFIDFDPTFDVKAPATPDTVVTPMPTGAVSSAIVVNPVSHSGYVANFGGNSLTLFGLDAALPSGGTITPVGAVVLGTDLQPQAPAGTIPDLGLNQVMGSASDSLSGILHVFVEFSGGLPIATHKREAKLFCHPDAAGKPDPHVCGWSVQNPLLSIGMNTIHVTVMDRARNTFSPPDTDLIVV